MAGYKYFTVLTDVGKQKLAEAIANETPLDFTEMAIGDSNGLSYDPVSDMTALKHVTYRAAIGSMKINAEDKNVMEFEFVVPASTGGFYVREAGLYSSDGTLIAISRLPEQYKADMAEGAGSSMTVRMLVAISSEAQIYITVPASIAYATQTYVAEAFKKHTQEEDPHQQYMLETYGNEIFATKESLTIELNAKADKTHNHDEVYVNNTDILSVSQGGHGANNINDARKNLETFRQYRLSNNSDLNDNSIYKSDGLYMYINGDNVDNRPHLVNTGCIVTYLDPYFKRGWQKFYPAGIGEEGRLTVWARTLSNNIWGEWKILRNDDGSIPADLINLPIGFSYIQAKGTNTPDTVFNTTGKWQDITSSATGFPAGTRIWKKIS